MCSLIHILSDCDKAILNEEQYTDNWIGETLCKTCGEKRNFKLEAHFKGGGISHRDSEDDT